MTTSNHDIARECGAYVYRNGTDVVFDTHEQLDAFVERIRADENSKIMQQGATKMTTTDTIPLFERDGFIITFRAQEEVPYAYEHFVNECGWTEEEYAEIAHHDWFCAVVSAWKDGVEVATEYLGGCSYEKCSDFYTTRGCYFDDMVESAIKSAKEIK